MNQRIKEVRLHENLTQKDFGESLGVSRDTLASYESGRVVPNKTFVQLLCAKYGVNEEWLNAGQGEMKVETTEDVVKRLTEKHKLGTYAENALGLYMQLNDAQRTVIDQLLLTIVEASTEATAAADMAGSAIDTVDFANIFGVNRKDTGAISHAGNAEVAQELNSLSHAERLELEALKARAEHEFLREKRQVSKVSPSQGSSVG